MNKKSNLCIPDDIKSVKLIPPRVVVEWDTGHFDEDGEPIFLETVYTRHHDFADLELTHEHFFIDTPWTVLERGENGEIPVQLEFNFFDL